MIPSTFNYENQQQNQRTTCDDHQMVMMNNNMVFPNTSNLNYNSSNNNSTYNNYQSNVNIIPHHATTIETLSTTTNNNNSSTTRMRNNTTCDEQKSEFTCLSCKQLHRKCDKILPSCSYCLKRGYECKYEKPKRKQQPTTTNYIFVDGNKKSISDQYSEMSTTKNHYCDKSSYSQRTTTIVNSINRKSEPYNHVNNFSGGGNFNRTMNTATTPNNNSIQNELNYRFVTTQTLDVYFDIIACGMPLVERRKMEQVLEYQSNLYHPSFSTSGCDFYSNQFEFEKDQSLLFTLQALCLQQMGHREISTPLFQQGRQLLGKYFDEIDSMSILLAMKFTSLYLLGEGERRKARVMMSTVKAGIEPYLKKNEKVKEITDLDLILNNAQSFTSLMIESQLKLSNMYLYEDLYPDTYLFEAIEEMSSRRMKFSELERSKGCKKLDRETYQKLRNIMKAFMFLTNAFVKCERVENVDNLQVLSLMFTRKQVWLEILINADESCRDLDEILQTCSEIMVLTRNRFFPYIQICATHGIILAATLRANYYYKLGPNENVNDDLRALRSLSKKFKYIQVECVDLIKALESLTYISNSNNMNPFSVDEIFNFTSQIDAKISNMLKPERNSLPEGGVSDGCYSEYREIHRPVLDQMMEADEWDEMVNCFMECDRIRKVVSDPLESLEMLHSRKMQLVKVHIERAIEKKDIYTIMASEVVRKQFTFDYELEKAKILGQRK